MDVITPLPRELYLACSGGSDSMFALHFLSRARRKIRLVYFHHKTEFGEKCLHFLRKLPYTLCIGYLEGEKPKQYSLEEWWSIERNKFFQNFDPIITAHHLNDQAETQFMAYLHGGKGINRRIHYKNGNIIRPFLNVSKEVILDYLNRHNIHYLDDPSNTDTRFTRNLIRHTIFPSLLKINGGFLQRFKYERIKFGENE